MLDKISLFGTVSSSHQTFNQHLIDIIETILGPWETEARGTQTQLCTLSKVGKPTAQDDHFSVLDNQTVTIGGFLHVTGPATY